MGLVVIVGNIMKPPGRVGMKNDWSAVFVSSTMYRGASSLPPPLTLPLSRCLSHPGTGPGSIRPPALLRLSVYSCDLNIAVWLGGNTELAFSQYLSQYLTLTRY